MITCVAPLLALLQDVAPPPAPAPSAESTPVEPRLEITSLANAGFLLHAGKFTVLIDAFVKEPYKEYEGLPPETFKTMVAGEPPFDGYVLCLVSHVHPDHFQPLVCKRFLIGNPDSGLVTSPQVVEALRPNDKEEKDSFRKIRQQVREIPVKKGEAKILKQEEMSVELMLLAHGGEQSRGLIQNYGHLLTMGSFKVLHIGDADIDPTIFEPYKLAERDIDVAIVPYWFFTNEQGVKIVDEIIHARSVIACHVPPAEKRTFIKRMKTENPHVLIFGAPMETVVLDRNEPAPAPPATDGMDGESSDDGAKDDGATGG